MTIRRCLLSNSRPIDRGGRLGLIAVLIVAAGCAARPRPLDEARESGFAVYRSGRLDPQRLADLCRLGVEEIVILDGQGAANECRWRTRVCPNLRVRYDHRQDARVPPSAEFLAAFDHWVETSRREGRKIAFRCRHGWHRTGRLAAYYRMRFGGWGGPEAVREMLAAGRFMRRFPELQPQVLAMAEQAEARRCSQAPHHCPSSGQPWLEGLIGAGAGARFAADVCDSSSGESGPP